MLTDKEQSVRAFLLMVWEIFTVTMFRFVLIDWLDLESGSSSSTLTPKSKHPAAAENLEEKSQVELSTYSV